MELTGIDHLDNEAEQIFKQPAQSIEIQTVTIFFMLDKKNICKLYYKSVSNL